MHLFTIWTNGNASKIAFHSKFHKGTNKIFLIFEHWPNVFKSFKPILGHFWLNSVNNDFKMCGITIKAIVQTYQSVQVGLSMMWVFLVLQWRILAFKLPILFHIDKKFCSNLWKKSGVGFFLVSNQRNFEISKQKNIPVIFRSRVYLGLSEFGQYQLKNASMLPIARV